jgi:PPOX class probable F420-dependent enzyme
VHLSDETCRSRLASGRFGVLGTVDARRGVHLVPVVYVMHEDRIVVPIDRVKPKATVRLRRIRNLDEDDRAGLLIDHRSDLWDELWWVRADLRFVGSSPPGRWAAALADRFPPYADPASVASVLTFTITAISGWQATD